MLDKIYKFRLDLKNVVNVPYMEFFQTDIGTSQINISIVNDGNVVNLEGHTVICNILKSDKTEVQNLVDIIDATNGLAQLNLTTQALASLGENTVQITVFEGVNRKSAHQFKYTVKPSILNEEVPTSTNEYGVLTQLIVDVQEVENILNLSEYDRNVAETLRQEGFNDIKSEYENIKTDIGNVKNELIGTNEIVIDNEDVRILNENNRINTFEGITDHYTQEKITLTNFKNDLININNAVSDAEVIRVNNENNRNNQFGVISDTWNDKELEINTLVENITNSEAIRNDNEDGREASESTRNSSEDTRKLNENQRISNEGARQDNENTRVQQEIDRVDEFTTIKNDLASVKNTMVNTNNSMNEEEVIRVNSENTRVQQETTRQSNEVNRQNGYSNMVDDWNSKNGELDTLKNSLNVSENQRVNNENIRQSSENQRVSNETTRGTTFNTKVSEVNTKISEVESAKNSMVNIFNALPAAQQQAAEVINMRTSTTKAKTFVSSGERVEELEKDVLTSQSTQVTDNISYMNVLANSLDGATDVSIKGNTLVNLYPDNVEKVLPIPLSLVDRVDSVYHLGNTLEGNSEFNLKGQSLVNLLGNKGTVVVNHTAEGTRLRKFLNVNFKAIPHTFIVNISNVISPPFTLYGEEYYADGTADANVVLATISSNGAYKIKRTPPKEVKDFFIKQSGVDLTNGKTFSSSQCMILEGDYTTQEIPYFEGIGSVENTTIKSVGENLFDDTRPMDVIREFTTSTISSGTVTVTSTSANSWRNAKRLVKVKPNTNYYLNFTVSDMTNGYVAIHNVTTGVSIKDLVTTPQTFNSGNNTLLHISFYANTINTILNTVTYSNIQLNEGTTPKTYSAYRSSQATITDTLRSVGSVVDEYVGNKKITRVGRVVLNGSETWISNDKFTNNLYLYSPVLDVLAKNTTISFLCDKFSSVPVYDFDLEGIFIYTGTNRLRINISKTKATDLATFKTWLSANNVEVLYELATPIETTITPLTLPTYLNGTLVVEPTKLFPKLSSQDTFDRTINLKPSTLYSIFVNAKNTGTLEVDLGGIKGNITPLTTYTNNKVTITTPSTLTHSMMKLKGGNISTKDYMVIETDVVEPKYFLGVSSVDSDVVIKSIGENLFDGILESGNISTVSGINNVDATKVRSKNFIKVKENGTFKISLGGVGKTVNVFYYDNNKNYMYYELSSTPIIPTRCSYIRFSYTSTDITEKILINEGSTIKTYTPYKEDKLTLSEYLLPEHLPLRSVGGVSDEVVGKKLYKKISNNEIFNGTEGWLDGTDLGTVYRFVLNKTFTNMLFSGSYAQNPILVMNGVYTKTNNYSTDTEHYYINTTQILIFINKTKIDKLTGATVIDKFKNYLSANVATLNYELATPTEINLDRPLNLQVYKNGSIVTEPTKLLPKLTYTYPTNIATRLDSLDTRVTNFDNYLDEIYNDLDKVKYSNVLSSEYVQSLSGSVEGVTKDIGIKGNTLINIVKNGNFASGTSGWVGMNATLTSTNNILSVIGNGASSVPGTYYDTSIPTVLNKKVFVKLQVKVTNSNCNSLELTVRGTTTGALPNATQSSPILNQTYTMYGITTLDANVSGNVRIRLNSTYADSTIANGKVMEVQNVMALDLTSLGLDTLSANQVNTMLNGYFEGMQSISANAKLISCGENLFDGNIIFPTLNVLSPTNTGLETVEGRRCVKIVSGDHYHNNTFFNKYKFKQNTQYTLRLFAKNSTDTNTGITFKIYYTDETVSSGVFVNATSFTEYKLTSTVGKTINYIGISYGVSGKTCYIDLDSIILNEGTIPLTYKPYQSSEIELKDYFKDDLHKINSTLYDEVVGDKLYKRLNKVALNGSENWADRMSNVTDDTINRIYSITGLFTYKKSSTMISNMKISSSVSLVDAYSKGEGVYYYNVSDTTYVIYIVLPKTKATDLTTFKTWLSTNNTLIIYELNTPTITTLASSLTVPTFEKGTIVTDSIIPIPLSYDYTTNRGGQIDAITKKVEKLHDGQQFILSYLLDIETRLTLKGI